MIDEEFREFRLAPRFETVDSLLTMQLRACQPLFIPGRWIPGIVLS